MYGLIRGSRYRKVYSKYLTLSKSQWDPHSKLLELSWKKTRNIIQYAYENVKYYHDVFKTNGIHPTDIQTPKDLVKIPITTKKAIKTNFPHNIISNKVPRDKWLLHSTSGSTGEPFEFAIDQYLSIGRSARDLLAYEWAGKEKRDKTIIMTGLREKTLKTKLLNRYARRTLVISAFDIHSTRHLENYITQIQKFQPKVIQGYTSSITVLAQYLANQDRYLGDWIDAVITTGETLSQTHRRLINERIGPVFDRYGCREFGSVSGECDRHFGEHIHSTSHFIEIVQDSEQVNAGERGQIILTNLENLVMPFIRYDMGDIAKISDETCSCGRGHPLLTDIEGRIVSLVETPSGKLISVHFLTLFFEDYGEYFVQFQAVQKTSKSMDLLIVPEKEVPQNLLDYVMKELHEYAGTDFNIQIKLVDSIPLGRTGKRELIRTEIN